MQNEKTTGSRFLFSTGAFTLRQAVSGTALQVVLKLANPLSGLNPAFPVFLLSLLGQFVQCWPVQRMVVPELDIASHGLHQMARRDMLTEIFIELHLLASDGIDERGDQLEEAPDHERYYTRLAMNTRNPYAGDNTHH